MKQLIFLSFFMFTSISFAQQWEWVRNVNGAANDYTSDLFVDDSGYVYATGRNKEGVTFEDDSNPITPTNYGHTDGFLAKYSNDGELIWAKLVGGSDPDWGWGVTVDDLGNVYFTGEFSGSATFGTDVFVSNGDRDVFISKLDMNGNFLWTKVFGDIGNDKGKGIDVDLAGNVYCTGFITGQVDVDGVMIGTDGVMNGFMVKLNSNGDFIHQEDIQPDVSQGSKIKCDDQGNVYVCGELLYDSYVADMLVTGSTTLSWRDGFIAKLDTAFNCEWVNVAAGQLHTGGESLTLNENHVYLTGFYTYTTDFNGTVLTYNGTGSGSSGINAGRDIYIAQYNHDGSMNWVKGFGWDGYDYGYDVAVSSKDDIYIAGIFADTVQFDSFELISEGGYDQYIAKLNSNGDVLWVKQHGSLEDIFVYAVSLDKNENLFVGGMYETGSADFDGIIKGTSQFDAYIGKLTQHTEPGVMYSTAGYCNGDTVKLVATSITSPITIAWDNMMPGGWEENGDYYFVATDGMTSFSGELIVANNIYSDTLILNEPITVYSAQDCGIGIQESQLNFEWNFNNQNQLLKIKSELSDGQLLMYDMNGSILMNSELPFGNSNYDLTRFANGVYLIQVLSAGQIIDAIKIVR